MQSIKIIPLICLFFFEFIGAQEQPVSEAVKVQDNISDFIYANAYKLYAKHDINDATLKSYPDIHYEFKIAELNKTTPLDLQYNKQVKQYIEYFASARKKDFETYFGHAKQYFPIFEEYLSAYNIPLEFKYLPILESGMNPHAVSKSKAIGLWQFKYHSGKLFDLRIDSYIDERSDPIQSTIAACKYLEYLYRTFGDWELVLAAFNGGPGEVRNAIQKSDGETDYWKLQSMFQKQTSEYIPKFVAIIYLANYYKYHDLTPTPSKYAYHETDTLRVNYQVSFEQISNVINVPVSNLKKLNPQYKLDIIPEDKDGLLLRLPMNKVLSYLQSENRIITRKDEIYDYHQMVSESKNTEGKNKIIHVVQQGENTHRIALKYECTLENIKVWNNLEGIDVFPGQELIIYVEP